MQGMALLALALVCAAAWAAQPATTKMSEFVLGFDTPVDPNLQKELERIDGEIRKELAMTPEQAAAGVLDLRTGRLAMIHPDRIEYAASVPKVGILLAYFELHPEAAKNLDYTTRYELALMAKVSSNEMAAKYSQQMGLKRIQEVINKYGLYDKDHGGGIWVGKHYGKGGERYGDPVGDHSHAATVRQLMRFWLLLDQGKLVSPEACATMKELFASPRIPHDPIKFVKGLEGIDATILRKWGSWEEWLHDSALVTGPGRHYILVGMTKHAKGDTYLEWLAARVDELLKRDAGL